MFYELQIHEANFDLTQKKSLYRKIYQLSDDSIRIVFDIYYCNVNHFDIFFVILWIVFCFVIYIFRLSFSIRPLRSCILEYFSV